MVAPVVVPVIHEQPANQNPVEVPAKGPKIGVPDKFDGTRGAKAEVYVTQIGLYVISNPRLFPDDRSKLFAGQPISYVEFSTAFQMMYYDTERRPRAEKALRQLKQTKSVAHYTFQFNQYAPDTGWETATLMSQYQQGLKKDVRLALVIARAQFTALSDLANLALKIDNEINGTDSAPIDATPTPDPNAMDLSAMKGHLATTAPHATFLIDSGATHDVLSESFTKRLGLTTRPAGIERTITGFDGSQSLSSREIDLILDNDPTHSTFIVTRLKDSYDGILGMPWIKKHGHLIDWRGRRFRTDSSGVATADAVSSCPKKSSQDGEEPVAGKARTIDEGVHTCSVITPPQCEPDFHSLSSDVVGTTGKQDLLLELPQPDHLDRTAGATLGSVEDSIATAQVSSTPPNTSRDGEEPVRSARLNDEGVHVSCVITPPQCESTIPHYPLYQLGTTGKRVHFLGFSQTNSGAAPDVWAAKALWSTSARLAAEAKSSTPALTAEELVPKCYHSYLHMFCKSNALRLPPRRKYDFRVELLPGTLPQTSRIIPLSPAENEALDTLIKEGLESGTIRRTTSPWAAPVLFTGKKDGNLRPCFDYRKLNAVTVKNKYPLPLTMDLVDSLLDADKFTKLDLRNAYGNLRVAEGNKEKLAFVCRAGQFAPLTMPFGPTGAPGFFQFFMQDILLGRIGKDVAAYLDEIMIYTQKGVEHEAAVSSVLDTLSKHQLWLKPEKCEFSRSEVEYLGLLISCNRVRMDPAKVTVVSEWPAPVTVTELQRFIGFANFYQRFIGDFSKITRPLHDLTRADIQFLWDGRCQEAFETLKTAFTTAPILKIADPYKPFLLECDCSDFALGAVLSQVCDKDNELHPVAYLSRSLIQAERNYEMFDKELLAIVAAFKEWRHYLEGNPNRLKAIVYTDHRNLESFMTTKSLTRRQVRWAETLGNFDFKIVFRPGRQSAKPDALSRRPDLAPTGEEKLTFGQLLKPENITPETFTAIAEMGPDYVEVDDCFIDDSIDLQDADRWFEVDVMGVTHEEDNRELIPTDVELINSIRKATLKDQRLIQLIGQCQDTSGGTEEWCFKDGVLYRRGLIEVPADETIRTAIVQSRHDCRTAGHPGRARTLALVRRCFNWPSQKKFVNRYVDGCESCQRVKSSTQKPFGTLEPLPIPAGPWTDISYDLITDLPESNGSNSILTVVDRLTKMAHFIPCKKSTTADDLADLMLRYVWKLHGTPKSIVSDRGSVFVSQITKELSQRLGIRLQPSTAYHPRTDGQSEIANKSVETYLRHFIGYHQDDWEPLLALAEFSHNNNRHASTGISPFKANYGFDVTI
ncbi:hypothetical protein PtA15_9A385 [Puccinia triticina]|uniref:Reverse transcriptase n=1 Tax=Puccinia triticina TaxID=208348 RepID=A0ABY7CV93_9BASI|nr:uncharacterized protein PtA15_9A385 [Puccinia triticina]WAQ88258.1 hypothetical protein PtA15_9A385 [Puccinia triticina]